MLPSYYSVRRPLVSDPDLPPRPFSPDIYSSPLGGKPLSCESAAVGGFPPLIDSYYPEAFGDYRSTAFSAPGGSFLPGSALSSLLPGYGAESSHLFLVSGGPPGGGTTEAVVVVASAGSSGRLQRDSWEQSVPEPVSQVEPLCADSLASVPPSMASPDPPGSPSQYRSPNRVSSMSSQPYAMHPLEEAHYHPLTPSTSYPLPSASFPCPPYMSGPIGDLAAKMEAAEASEGPVGLSGEGAPCWPKEEGINSWPPYEVRRPF